MPSEPEIQPLSYARRTFIFRFFILIFLLVLPLVIFYATGYRFEFSSDSTMIVSTGGLYISVPSEEAQIYINEEPVRDIRVFRRASYIQNLDVGIHRVHVQGDGLYTWVKNLPVQPHIVTEAQTFNMPLVPQIRLIAPYVDLQGRAIFNDIASSTLSAEFAFASVTEPVIATTTLPVRLLSDNQEYEYVSTLFGTSTKSVGLVSRVRKEVNQAFIFSGDTAPTTTATTTLIQNDVKLYQDGNEVFVAWLGNLDNIPYYFCIDHDIASSTIVSYGQHVYEGIATVMASDMPETETQNKTGKICRSKIRIDNKGKEVNSFAFFPSSTDLILMNLDDGIYVVEVDDRSWQNTQQIYPGNNLDIEIDGGRIFVKDREYLVEVFTELIETI